MKNIGKLKVENGSDNLVVDLIREVVKVENIEYKKLENMLNVVYEQNLELQKEIQRKEKVLTSYNRKQFVQFNWEMNNHFSLHFDLR